MCLSLFLQCARFFLQGRRYQQHLVANELAALICLQLKAVQIHLAASLQEQQGAVARQAQPTVKNVEPSELTTEGPIPTVSGIGPGWDGDDGLKPHEAMDAPGHLAEESHNENTLTPANGATTIGPTTTARAGLLAAENITLQTVGGNSDMLAALVVPPEPLEDTGPALGTGGTILGPAGDPFVVINLEAREVEVFAEYHHDFVVALQVVSAYRHTYDEGLFFKVWPRALYRQVVLLGNRLYLQIFMLHLPLTKEHLEATVRLYLNEQCPEQYPTRAQRMKQFLNEGVPNLETRYQLTKQLGTEFADMSMETASLVYMT